MYVTRPTYTKPSGASHRCTSLTEAGQRGKKREEKRTEDEPRSWASDPS